MGSPHLPRRPRSTWSRSCPSDEAMRAAAGSAFGAGPGRVLRQECSLTSKISSATSPCASRCTCAAEAASGSFLFPVGDPHPGAMSPEAADQAPTAWKPPSTWTVSPVVAGNQSDSSATTALAIGLGVLEVPAERCRARSTPPRSCSKPGMLLAAMLRIRARAHQVHPDALRARGRGRGSAPPTRTRPSTRPSSRRRATPASSLSKSRPTIEPPGPISGSAATASAFSE